MVEEAEEAMTELRQRLALSGVWEEAAGMKDQIIEWAKELQSLAQAGLFYGRDPFDQERYGRIREISAEMLADRTGIPVKTVQGLFCNDTGYQTPKVDTRAAVFQDGKILLVQERDGLWSMPGGWCEYNLSPAENTVKEAREEAGVHVAVKRRSFQPPRGKPKHPPYSPGRGKAFCR